MTEMHSLLDRLEARIDQQAARIDALYRELEERGMLRGAAQAQAVDPLFDELVDVEDAPLATEVDAEGQRPHAAPLHLGDAAGV
jgi:hypothetical protein